MRVLLSAAAVGVLTPSFHGHSNHSSPPTINESGSPVTYVAGGTPAVLAAGATITDSATAFASSSLTAQFTYPQPTATTTDQLSLVAGNGITVSTGSVLYNGTVIGTETGGTGGVALVVTFNSTATQAGVQAVLDQFAYSNSSASPGLGDRLVSFQFTDGGGLTSHSAFQEVHVVSPAAITNPGPSVTYAAGGAPVLIATTALVTDTNNAFAGSSLNIQFSSAQSATSTNVLSIVAGNGVTLNAGSVLYNGTAIGTETGGTGVAALVVTFNSSATQAGVQAVLDQVAYSNTSLSPTVGHLGVVFQLTDGNGATSQQVSQRISITPASAITNLGPSVIYVAGSTPVVIAAGALVTDTTNTFANSILSIQFASSQSTTSTNVLSLLAGSGVTLNAGSVLYNGTVIGTVTGGTGIAALVVTFNASATQAGVQAVLDQVAYSNTSATPRLGENAVVFQFTDGNGSASQFARQEVRVTSSPAITQLGNAVAYTVGSTPVVIAGTAQVIDTNSAFANSSVNVQIAPSWSTTTTNVLSILTGNGVTLSAGSMLYNGTAIGTVTGGTAGVALVVTFNASATQAGVQAVIDQIAYSNTSASPNLGNRSVSFQFTDGNGIASQVVHQQVYVVPVATITHVKPPVTYTPGSVPVAIAAGAQVTDAKNAFAGSSITIQFASAQSTTSTNVLSLIAGNGVTVNAGQVLYNSTVIGTVTGGTGITALVVTFNASATQAGVQAVLDQVGYSNTNSTVNHREVGITLQFTDGNGSASPLVHQEVEIK